MTLCRGPSPFSLSENILLRGTYEQTIYYIYYTD